MKRVLCIFLVLISIFALAGCNNKTELHEASNGVKLANYTNLEFTKTEYIVSEKYLDDMVNSVVKYYKSTDKVKEGVVSENDTINISYTTYVGQQKIEEATLSDFSFTLGEGILIKKLETSLIGKNVGELFQVEITYPLGSTFTIVDGKTVTHHVTVNYIEKNVYPALTDELIQLYVKDSTSLKEAACKTVADYREYLRERYEFVYAKISNDNLVSDILDYLIENSELPTIAASELDLYVENKYNYYVEYCKNNNFTMKEYLSSQGMTEAEFKVQLRKDGEELMKKTMVVNAIRELEGLTLTDEFYNSYLEYLTKYYQFDSVEELKKSIVELNAEDTIKNDATYELVYQFLLKNQKITVQKDDLYNLEKAGDVE